jgi:hypothetical protein
MKWAKKYLINLDEVYQKHLEGNSLPALSKMYNVPRTTLARYFESYNLVIHNHKHGRRCANMKRRLPFAKAGDDSYVYKTSTAWKRGLLQVHPHQCSIALCGYTAFVEAHHILPAVDGGKMTIKNGCLLCPNHHAEAHAGLIDIDALLKRGELLESRENGNQQPSCVSNDAMRDTEGSETRDHAKAVLSPRAPRIVGIPKYMQYNNDDIVRTAEIIKQQKSG